MAQKVLVTLEDDLDGGPAQETIRFGLDGHEYEIDLNGVHAKGLRKTVEAYARSGRQVRGPHVWRRRPASARRQTAARRAWAKEQGYNPSERGRLAAWIEDEYRRVHST